MSGVVTVTGPTGWTLKIEASALRRGSFCGWDPGKLHEIIASSGATVLLPNAGASFELIPETAAVPEMRFRVIAHSASASVGWSHSSDDPKRARRERQAARCKSALEVAARLLPPAERAACDEWVDEIECAAERGRPVRRRVWSILWRTLPVIVWQGRRSKRVSRRGS